MTFVLQRVVPAAAVLVVGVGLALLARAAVARLIRRTLPGGPEEQARSAAGGVFWFMVLVTVVISTSLLAPNLLADVPAQVLRFLPKLGVALVMLWLGLLGANLLRQVVETMARRMRVPTAAPLGKVVYWSILGLAILMAADQLGVETQVLTTVLYIVLFSAGLAVALALGFGGRGLAGNVIAGRYVDDRFTVGEQIEVEDLKGTIVEVGLSSITIADSQGELIEVPHAFLLTRPVRRSGT